MKYPDLAPGARLLAVTLRSSNGEEIGQVKEWMMDVDEGRVVYVLADIDKASDELVAIPWTLMKADKEKGGYQVNAEREALQNAPKIHRDQLKDLIEDKGFLDRVFENFQATKYWNRGEAGERNDESTNGQPGAVGAS